MRGCAGAGGQAALDPDAADGRTAGAVGGGGGGTGSWGRGGTRRRLGTQPASGGRWDGRTARSGRRWWQCSRWPRAPRRRWIAAAGQRLRPVAVQRLEQAEVLGRSGITEEWASGLALGGVAMLAVAAERRSAGAVPQREERATTQGDHSGGGGDAGSSGGGGADRAQAPAGPAAARQRVAEVWPPPRTVKV